MPLWLFRVLTAELSGLRVRTVRTYCIYFVAAAKRSQKFKNAGFRSTVGDVVRTVLLQSSTAEHTEIYLYAKELL
jgi:hypothetical protein